MFIGDFAGGKRLGNLTGYASTIGLSNRTYHQPSLAFSADGKLLAASGGENLVRVWQTAGAKEVRPVPEGHEGSVSALAAAPDGKMIASAATDGTVRLWETKTGRELRVLATKYDKASPLMTAPVFRCFLT